MSKYPFKLGVITDEVSQDIFEAAEFAKKHGLDTLEIRSVNDRSPYALTDEDVAQIKKAATDNSLEVVAISSPLFKCDFDDAEARKAQIEGFKRCVEIAKVLGAKLIRGFDFWNAGVSVEDRAAAYAPIIEICEKEDVYCAIEFDPSVHSSTPSLTAELVKAINHPRIGALYDPGNAIYSEPEVAPYPDGYNALKPYLSHVHIKDAAIINGAADSVKVGTGVVDYLGLFKQLIADGYKGNVMLETHYRKNVELTEEQLKRPGGSAFSLGAYPASEESIISLKEIIDKAMQ